MQGGNANAVTALLDKGVDPRSSDNNGSPVLAFARVLRQAEIASILENRMAGH